MELYHNPSFNSCVMQPWLKGLELHIYNKDIFLQFFGKNLLWNTFEENHLVGLFLLCFWWVLLSNNLQMIRWKVYASNEWFDNMCELDLNWCFLSPAGDLRELLEAAPRCWPMLREVRRLCTGGAWELLEAAPLWPMLGEFGWRTGRAPEVGSSRASV